MESALDFDDVLIVPQRSYVNSRQDVDLKRHFGFYNSSLQHTSIPVIAANMDTTGTIAMAKATKELGCLTALHKFYSNKKLLNQIGPYDNVWGNTFYTIGATNDDLNKLNDLVATVGMSPKFICIDVANGYTCQFLKAIKQVRQICETSIIMAGNICTPDMVLQIIGAGADIVKVGVGPGQACSTRMITGVGYPQLTAIQECSKVAHSCFNKYGYTPLICADGGCKTPGDVAKAFGAGADFVMLGGMLAGTDECEGEWEYEYIVNEFTKVGMEVYDLGPKKSLKFYGMSSKTAQNKYYGGLDSYKAAEGLEMTVPYKGPVKEVMQEILGGLRSACTYVGATNLEELQSKVKFVKVNRVK